VPSAAALAGVALVALAACGHPGVTATPHADRLAPDSFQVAIETTRGQLLLIVNRSWAPHGVDRFYSLVRVHYYDNAPIYRVVRQFVAQFGLAASPRLTATFKRRAIPDDSVHHSNVRGAVSFASAGPGTRTTQLFINLVDNPRLDGGGRGGYPPIGQVLRGMELVDQFDAEYEGTMPGRVQDSISLQGDAYVRRAFPRLDHVVSMKILREWKR
jgi:peptidyl-prolyl cis-trans isomerase A (cyclophilin A)